MDIKDQTNIVDKITNFYYTKIALQKYAYLYKTGGMKKIWK
jgi:hypothetical protein